MKQELRALNVPKPIRVKVGAGGRPLVLHLEGRARRIRQILNIWQIDDEWWRDRISRRYATVVLENGQMMTIYRNLLDGRWYVQEG